MSKEQKSPKREDAARVSSGNSTSSSSSSSSSSSDSSSSSSSGSGSSSSSSRSDSRSRSSSPNNQHTANGPGNTSTRVSPPDAALTPHPATGQQDAVATGTVMSSSGANKAKPAAPKLIATVSNNKPIIPATAAATNTPPAAAAGPLAANGPLTSAGYVVSGWGPPANLVVRPSTQDLRGSTAAAPGPGKTAGHPSESPAILPHLAPSATRAPYQNRDREQGRSEARESDRSHSRSRSGQREQARGTSPHRHNSRDREDTRDFDRRRNVDEQGRSPLMYRDRGRNVDEHGFPPLVYRGSHGRDSNYPSSRDSRRHLSPPQSAYPSQRSHNSEYSYRDRPALPSRSQSPIHSPLSPANRRPPAAHAKPRPVVPPPPLKIPTLQLPAHHASSSSAQQEARPRQQATPPHMLHVANKAPTHAHASAAVQQNGSQAHTPTAFSPQPPHSPLSSKPHHPLVPPRPSDQLRQAPSSVPPPPPPSHSEYASPPPPLPPPSGSHDFHDSPGNEMDIEQSDHEPGEYRPPQPAHEHHMNGFTPPMPHTTPLQQPPLLCLPSVGNWTVPGMSQTGGHPSAFQVQPLLHNPNTHLASRDRFGPIVPVIVPHSGHAHHQHTSTLLLQPNPVGSNYTVGDQLRHVQQLGAAAAAAAVAAQAAHAQMLHAQQQAAAEARAKELQQLEKQRAWQQQAAKLAAKEAGLAKFKSTITAGMTRLCKRYGFAAYPMEKDQLKLMLQKMHDAVSLEFDYADNRTYAEEDEDDATMRPLNIAAYSGEGVLPPEMKPQHREGPTPAISIVFRSPNSRPKDLRDKAHLYLTNRTVSPTRPEWTDRLVPLVEFTPSHTINAAVPAPAAPPQLQLQSPADAAAVVAAAAAAAAAALPPDNPNLQAATAAAAAAAAVAAAAKRWEVQLDPELGSWHYMMWSSRGQMSSEGHSMTHLRAMATRGELRWGDVILRTSDKLFLPLRMEPTPKTALVWDGSRPTPAAATAAQPGPSTGGSQGGTAATTPQETSPPASETTSLTALLNPSLVAVIHATKAFTASLNRAAILANVRSMGHGGTWFPASNPTAQQHQTATPSACATHTNAPSIAAGTAAADRSACAMADEKRLEAASLLLNVGRLWKSKKQQLAPPSQAAAAVGGAVTVPGGSSSGGTSDCAIDPVAGFMAAVDKSSAAGAAGGSGSSVAAAPNISGDSKPAGPSGAATGGTGQVHPTVQGPSPPPHLHAAVSYAFYTRILQKHLLPLAQQMIAESLRSNEASLSGAFERQEARKKAQQMRAEEDWNLAQEEGEVMEQRRVQQQPQQQPHQLQLHHQQPHQQQHHHQQLHHQQLHQPHHQQPHQQQYHQQMPHQQQQERQGTHTVAHSGSLPPHSHQHGTGVQAPGVNWHTDGKVGASLEVGPLKRKSSFTESAPEGAPDSIRKSVSPFVLVTAGGGNGGGAAMSKKYRSDAP